MYSRFGVLVVMGEFEIVVFVEKERKEESWVEMEMDGQAGRSGSPGWSRLISTPTNQRRMWMFSADSVV